MNKQELVAELTSKTEFSKSAAERFINSFVETVSDALAEGDKVQLIGFGTFETRQRNGRYATNPKAGGKVWVNPKIVPAFKAGKALKDAINK